MDRKPQPEASVGPLYSFYGNNASYHFVNPGDYNIRMSMSPHSPLPSSDSNRQQVFNSTTEMTANFIGWKTPERRANTGQCETLPGTPLQSAAAMNTSLHQPPPSSPVPNTPPQSPLINFKGLGNSGFHPPASPTHSLSSSVKSDKA